MSSSPEVPSPEVNGKLAEQTALACYLSTVVAIGNCMAEVCPPIGTVYRDRLLRLPRRLGFEATPQALKQSREAVETDLLEYGNAAGTWIQSIAERATRILSHLLETRDTLTAAADLQRAFVDDLAEHLETSAQVDDETELRRAVARCAAGLRSYAGRTRAEKFSVIDEFQRRAEEIEAWRTEAAFSVFSDADSGLPNRAAAERRLHTEIAKHKPFCVILVGWTREDSSSGQTDTPAVSGQIAKELGDRLAATIRPYDLVFRWSPNQLITVFEAPKAKFASRAKQIAGWLAHPLVPVEIEGAVSDIKTQTRVSVIENEAGETVAQLTERIEADARQELAAR